MSHVGHGSPEIGDITERKARHLEICLDQGRYAVETNRTRLDEVNPVHRSLPEVSDDQVDTTIDFLGYRCRLPVFISSMTGGSTEGYRTNKDLATVASELGIAVGMGSIRILLRKPGVIDDFRLKRFAPTVPVFANFGGVQLPHTSHDEIFRLIEELQVDGIAIHLNPGQELFQPGGDRDFQGILQAIGAFTRRSPVPVIVKETGFGIHPGEVAALQELGVAYVDIAGSGGTNWTRVESYRHEEPHMISAAREFDTWGLPTALILTALGRTRRGILASGGIRSGMDVTRCLALGSHAVGMALPFVRALRTGGIAEALALGAHLEQVIRAALVLTGCHNPAELARTPLCISPSLRAEAAELARQTSGEKY